MNQFSKWYRKWNRYSYLSGFERRLNRALWALLIVGVVYAILQHVALANVPEVFPTGARWGDLFFDLAIAYVGAFLFYLLNIRLPLRRERRNVYQNLGPLFDRIVSATTGLMTHLNSAADLPANRKNTLENVGDLCMRLQASSSVPSFRVPTATGFRIGSVMELFRHSEKRTNELINELLVFTQYLTPQVVDYAIAIRHRGYFGIFDAVDSAEGESMGLASDDMRWLTRHLFDHLQLVDRLDQYYGEYFHAFRFDGTFLISGTHNGSDAVPLQQRMGD